jgi:hypothetical protein
MADASAINYNFFPLGTISQQFQLLFAIILQPSC